jgi:hypothetical protein
MYLSNTLEFWGIFEINSAKILEQPSTHDKLFISNSFLKFVQPISHLIPLRGFFPFHDERVTIPIAPSRARE